MKDPTRSAAKWARNLSAATEDMMAGADRLTTSPTQLAKAKQAKMLAGFNQAVQSGKWAAGLDRVTVDQWREAYKNKGIPRIQGGTTQAQPKMADFLAKLGAYQQAGLAQIKAMPDLTAQDGANRAAAWVLYMAKFKR